MARMTLSLSVKLPWWYRARIMTLAALANAGFTIDLKAEAREIARNARISARSAPRGG